jgi:hypothetical protein
MLSSPLITVIRLQEVDKGDGAVKKTAISPKIGDRFKDKETGKVFVVTIVDKNEVLLVGENGLGRRLTGVDSLSQTCQKLEDKES